MVKAMGGKCSECGKTLPPEQLIIHHTAFEQGKKLGSGNYERINMLYEFAQTGVIPEGVRLLCDRCNRKRHKYRPSNLDIFGAEPKSIAKSPSSKKFKPNFAYAITSKLLSQQS